MPVWLKHHLGNDLRAEVVFFEAPKPSFFSIARDFRSDRSGSHIPGAYKPHESVSDAKAHAEEAVKNLHSCDSTCAAYWDQIT